MANRSVALSLESERFGSNLLRRTPNTISGTALTAHVKQASHASGLLLLCHHLEEICWVGMHNSWGNGCRCDAAAGLVTSAAEADASLAWKGHRHTGDPTPRARRPRGAAHYAWSLFLIFLRSLWLFCEHLPLSRGGSLSVDLPTVVVVPGANCTIYPATYCSKNLLRWSCENKAKFTKISMNLIQLKGFFFPPLCIPFLCSRNSRLDIPFTCVADRVDATGLHVSRVLRIMRVIPKRETHEWIQQRVHMLAVCSPRCVTRLVNQPRDADEWWDMRQAGKKIPHHLQCNPLYQPLFRM